MGRLFRSLSLIGIGVSAITAPALGGDAKQGLCVTVCNHWSYTGIGWQLGIESDVLSATDAMGMSDRAGVKTCLELDAKAYERIAKQFPEVAKRLSKYLAQGKIEIVGGAYGQPMGCMFSGESVIRQLVEGRRTIKKALNYDISTFLEEEEFTFPSLPQLLKDSEYRYASIAQVDTWGRAGIPPVEVNCFNWQGIDGTSIPTTPKNSLFRADLDWNRIAPSAGYLDLSAQGKPLLTVWEEYGWEPPETPAYLSEAGPYRDAAAKAPIEYVTLKQYMDEYGQKPAKTIFWGMDAWNKSLTWGLGGDQLRIYNNKVEGTLTAAERFDAVASSLGSPSQSSALGGAWKDLLASQSHDVGLCEYSRWQSDRMAPLDRLEDHHNFTWGSLGYNLLDSAQQSGQQTLDAALKTIASKVDSSKQGALVCTVFNPYAWNRSDVVDVGRLPSIPPGTKSIYFRDRLGRAVPSQVTPIETDPQGNLVVAKASFVASDVPSVGFDTYSVSFSPRVPAGGGLKSGPFSMENASLKVTIDPGTGSVSSLFDKRSGREMLKTGQDGYPTFRGKPNTSYPLRDRIPAEYDSAKSKAEVSWVENGPVRATIKARYNWRFLLYETYVTLTAGSPYVEVTTRLLPEVPPMPDKSPPDIKEGYWMSFAPSFKATSVLRDYPLATEETKHNEFHALNFVDLVGSDGGLLVLHPGTQFFRFELNGDLSNLLMREWESYYSSEYGWPRYAEYRHALMPHGAGFSNMDRERSATNFKQPLIFAWGTCHGGQLPSHFSFLSLDSPSTDLMAFRRLRSGYEIRLAEQDGKKVEAGVRLSMPVRNALRTNLMGRVVGSVNSTKNGFRTNLSPWKVQTTRFTN